MLIARPALRKRLQTDPAYMRSTPAARHMVASLRFLHGRAALGTVLDAPFPFEFFERGVPA